MATRRIGWIEKALRITMPYLTAFRHVILEMSLIAVTATMASASTELLSITNITLPPNGYVQAFTITTWGVNVLAVCHLPPGWTITAGKSADPTGVLSGKASLGVTFLNTRGRLDELHGLFLVDLEAFQATERRSGASVYPATFKGRLTEGTYGYADLHLHDVSLKQENLVREPATRCP